MRGHSEAQRSWFVQLEARLGGVGVEADLEVGGGHSEAVVIEGGHRLAGGHLVELVEGGRSRKGDTGRWTSPGEARLGTDGAGTELELGVGGVETALEGGSDGAGTNRARFEHGGGGVGTGVADLEVGGDGVVSKLTELGDDGVETVLELEGGQSEAAVVG